MLFFALESTDSSPERQRTEKRSPYCQEISDPEDESANMPSTVYVGFKLRLWVKQTLRFQHACCSRPKSNSST